MATLLSKFFLNFQTEVAKKYSLLDKLNDFSLVVNIKVHFIALVINLKNILSKKIQTATGASCYLSDMFKQGKDIVPLYQNQVCFGRTQTIETFTLNTISVC